MQSLVKAATQVAPNFHAMILASFVWVGNLQKLMLNSSVCSYCQLEKTDQNGKEIELHDSILEALPVLWQPSSILTYLQHCQDLVSLDMFQRRQALLARTGLSMDTCTSTCTQLQAQTLAAGRL